MATLIHWDPWSELERVRPRDLFERWPWRVEGETEWSPRCDVTHWDGALIVHAELPGVDAKDIEISVTDGCLTIRGEKRQEKKAEEGARSYRERFFGSFERDIAIPAGLGASKIAATMKDGVLEVRVPLPTEQEAESRKIPVKVA